LNDKFTESGAESNTLASLSERTADMTEDIEERVEISKAILAEEDDESEVEQTQVVGEEETLE
jgi:hypothetical protein